MGHGHDDSHGRRHGPPRQREEDAPRKDRAGADQGKRDRVPGEHKARAPRSAKVYVITCSDSRTEATDEGGRILRDALARAGHVLSGSAIVPDDPRRIAAELDRASAAGAQFALVTGGTGLSSRDSTFEAIARAVARPLPGFGELFRSLSYEEIGSAAMLSRALAGQLQSGLFVFAMPGSPDAVRLACEKLILPELTHILEELSR
jgi:molybdopterin adenylyltransferase